MCVHAHVCTCVCMHACIYMRVCVCMHMCARVCMCAYLSVCIVCLWVSVHTHVHVYVYTCEHFKNNFTENIKLRRVPGVSGENTYTISFYILTEFRFLYTEGYNQSRNNIKSTP